MKMFTDQMAKTAFVHQPNQNSTKMTTKKKPIRGTVALPTLKPARIIQLQRFR